MCKNGIIAGTWDLLHPGHLDAISSAKQHLDEDGVLIVALHVDPSMERPQKNKPIETVFERYFRLEACKDVTAIVPYETEADLENILRMYHFDCYFVGEDHINDIVTGHKICEDNNIDIVFLDRSHKFSSSTLRKKIAVAENTVVAL